MNSLVLVGYYMVKEAVHPRLHHSDFEEYLEDVDMDCLQLQAYEVHSSLTQACRRVLERSDQYVETDKCSQS